MTKDWRKLGFFVPVSHVTEKLKDTEREEFFIEGTAINSTITRNGVKYTAEELEPATMSLMDKPILKDHNNTVDNIVGRVKHAYFDPTAKAVKFKGQIMDGRMKEMIQDGRITNVSIGARVKDLVAEESGDEKYVIAKGIEILELSLVPVPGDAGAVLGQALSEAFNIKEVSEKEKHMEEHNMDEKVNATLQEQAAEITKLKSQLEEKQKEEMNKIAEENKQLKELMLKLSEKQETQKTKGIVKEVHTDEEQWQGYFVGKNESGKTEVFKMPDARGKY